MTSLSARKLVSVLALGLLASFGLAVPASPAQTSAPCGSLAASYDPAAPPTYTHVVVLMEENLSYNTWKTMTQAPYAHQLASACGEETNFHAATHPSQPNYMAATSGVATGVGVKTSNDNVFHQTQAAGRTWRLYAESMGSPCQAGKTTFYKPGHNPAFYYTDLRSPVNTCNTFDVPMSPALDNAITNDSLPSYTWITPNLCHAFYWNTGCPNTKAQRFTVGDNWLSTFIPRLTAMPSYQAGKTLILVTWDEGDQTSPSGIDCTDPTVYSSHPDCHIPTFVVSPYITPGKKDAGDHNLYGLLGTTEDILHLPRLNRAVGQGSLRAGLGF